MRDRLRVERSPTSHSVGRFTLASSSLSRTLSAPLVALNAASVKRNAASRAGGHTGHAERAGGTPQEQAFMWHETPLPGGVVWNIGNIRISPDSPLPLGGGPAPNLGAARDPLAGVAAGLRQEVPYRS